MIKVEQPDYELKIGIKNGKVCNIHWGQEFYLHEGEMKMEQVRKKLKKYYRLAAKMTDSTTGR